MVAFPFISFILLNAYLCKRTKRSHQIVLFISMTFALILFVGTKTDYTTDVFRYQEKYKYIDFLSMSDIWSSYLNGNLKDGGFYILMKLCKISGMPYQLFLTILASIYIIPVMILVYRKSEDCFLSILMFLFLSWITFVVSGLRQSIAMSLCIVALLIQLENKKSIVPLFLIAFAFFFHSSALVFIFAYIIIRFSISLSLYSTLALSALSVLMATVGQVYLRKLISIVTINSRFENYTTSEVTLNWSGFIIQLGMVLACYFLYKSASSIEENKKTYEPLMTLSAFGLIVQAFSSFIGEFFRISMYYSIVVIVLLPHCLNLYRKKYSSNIMIYLAYLLFFVYSFISPKYIGYTSCIFG